MKIGTLSAVGWIDIPSKNAIQYMLVSDCDKSHIVQSCNFVYSLLASCIRREAVSHPIS